MTSIHAHAPGVLALALLLPTHLLHAQNLAFPRDALSNGVTMRSANRAPVQPTGGGRSFPDLGGASATSITTSSADVPAVSFPLSSAPTARVLSDASVRQPASPVRSRLLAVAH